MDTEEENNKGETFDELTIGADSDTETTSTGIDRTDSDEDEEDEDSVWGDEVDSEDEIPDVPFRDDE